MNYLFKSKMIVGYTSSLFPFYPFPCLQCHLKPFYDCVMLQAFFENPLKVNTCICKMFFKKGVINVKSDLVFLH